VIVTYPRLPTAAAVSRLAELISLDGVAALSATAAIEDPRADTYATGAPVPSERLATLREAMLECAAKYGFPQRLGTRSEDATNFDRDASVLLLRQMDVLPADAAQEGVWSFLALILLPDVALWRWPDHGGRADYERLIGKPRNVFRRLWWRAYCLGESNSAEVFEDEAVAIMERPTIGGDVRLARILADNHLRMARENRDLPRTELLRDVAKRIRRLSVLVTFAALSDDELLTLVRETSDDALAALVGSRAAKRAGRHRASARVDS
jgi:hypothetical protein